MDFYCDERMATGTRSAFGQGAPIWTITTGVGIDIDSEQRCCWEHVPARMRDQGPAPDRWNKPPVRVFVLGGDGRAIAMKDQYFAAIAIAALAAGTGCAVYSLSSQSDHCPQPWSASVTALFAPCQAVYSAMGAGARGTSPQDPEAMQVELLTADAQSAPGLPATLLAERLAGSVDPFLRPSGS